MAAQCQGWATPPGEPSHSRAGRRLCLPMPAGQQLVNSAVVAPFRAAAGGALGSYREKRMPLAWLSVSMLLAVCHVCELLQLCLRVSGDALHANSDAGVNASCR